MGKRICYIGCESLSLNAQDSHVTSELGDRAWRVEDLWDSLDTSLTPGLVRDCLGNKMKSNRTRHPMTSSNLCMHPYIPLYTLHSYTHDTHLQYRSGLLG